MTSELAVSDWEVGVNLAVSNCAPATAGRQLQLTCAGDPELALLEQPGILFPPIKNVTFPAELSVAVIVVDIPFRGGVENVMLRLVLSSKSETLTVSASSLKFPAPSVALTEIW